MPCSCSAEPPKQKRPPPIVQTPSLWGPSVWLVGHTVSFWYTPSKAVAARAFFEQLHTWLPCPSCAEHYAALVRTELPLGDVELASADALSRWFVTVHNRVNARLRKPPVPYARARALYLGGARSGRPRTAVSRGWVHRWRGAFWRMVLVAAFGGGAVATLLAVAPGLLPTGPLGTAATPAEAVALHSKHYAAIAFEAARDRYVGPPAQSQRSSTVVRRRRRIR